MNPKEIIEQAEQYVKQELGADSSGHDWWHIYRVRRLAMEIAQQEQADPFICELSALLHDIADAKLNPSKEAGLNKVESWLRERYLEPAVSEAVMTIISTMSYNGGKNPPLETIEGKVVQDADRLDAIGAIGVARTFVYSGWRGRLIYDPEPGSDTAVAHFYDKMFKLKNLMNTTYAKQLAEQRHQFMEQYIEQFLAEWNLDK